MVLQRILKAFLNTLLVLDEPLLVIGVGTALGAAPELLVHLEGLQLFELIVQLLDGWLEVVRVVVVAEKGEFPSQYLLSYALHEGQVPLLQMGHVLKGHTRCGQTPLQSW